MRNAKNTPPLRNLITTDTNYLSYLRRFSNFDDTTVNHIMFHYEAGNMNDGTINYISVTHIASENTEYLVTTTEEEEDYEAEGIPVTGE